MFRMAGKSFRVRIKEYAEEEWTWITTSGPERLESDSNGTVQANLTIPEGTSLPRLDGYIKISSDSHTFEIPVSVTIAGTRLAGLTKEEAVDLDNDGLFDVPYFGLWPEHHSAGRVSAKRGAGRLQRQLDWDNRSQLCAQRERKHNGQCQRHRYLEIWQVRADANSKPHTLR